ncbi:hypothetical protein DN051_37805 [Streptomyces cadmiisoli]|uniref:AB hydrolase-1 domain-containing protein n=1 Tax=Streptomyces cadmiisoli TaxID=2184053 RepID=A0A2Z4J951_9ACTN|nr:hypothetical protein DN051_37805 [Streptomyces cadmiisoli]
MLAAANPLRGLASDAAYVRSVIKRVSGSVVLVGHSCGGAVISSAAADVPQVKALVHIAAFAPDKGESALGLSGKFPGSTLGPTLNQVPFQPPPTEQRRRAAVLRRRAPWPAPSGCRAARPPRRWCSAQPV